MVLVGPVPPTPPIILAPDVLSAALLCCPIVGRSGFDECKLLLSSNEYELLAGGNRPEPRADAVVVAAGPDPRRVEDIDPRTEGPR